MMKILASDYDGTLNRNGTVSDTDVRAVESWRNAGNLFVMDTGRSMESILEETEHYHIPVDYYITNNGGMLFDKDRRVLFSSYLDKEISDDVICMAPMLDHVVSYVVNDGFYRHRIVVNEELTEFRYPGLEPDLSVEEVMGLPASQIVISFDSQEAASAVAEKMGSLFGDKISVFANKYVVDVVPKGISKAHGLKLLQDRLHLSQEDFYGIGDADNDIPLMAFSREGACIAGASEGVRRHAAHVCDSVAGYIRQILHN